MNDSCIGKYPYESNRRKNVMVTTRQDSYKISREHSINLSKLLESSLAQLFATEDNAFSLV